MGYNKYIDPRQHSAQEWEALAVQCARRSQESWERSDTDGCLSQWANDAMCHLYRDASKVAANGNKREIAWLFDANTGQPVEDWRWVETRYGSSVAIGERPDTVWFRPSCARDEARREAADRAKGFVFGRVECEVLLFQFGQNVLLTGYRRRRGAALSVVSVGGYAARVAA